MLKVLLLKTTYYTDKNKQTNKEQQQETKTNRQTNKKHYVDPYDTCMDQNLFTVPQCVELD